MVGCIAQGAGTRLVGLLVLGVLSACAASGGGATPPATSPSTQGSGGKAEGTGVMASDFASRDVEGRSFRLADHLGKKVILLDFWSTFCQPCLAAMPHLNKLYESHKAKGFVIVGVAMDGPETVAEVPSFVRRNAMAFPVVLDEDSHVAGIYNPRKSAPLSVLIDRSGKVVTIHEGYNPGDEEVLAKEVAKALGEGAP